MTEDEPGQRPVPASNVGRVVTITLLTIAATAQLVFIFLGLVGMALGGVTAGEFGLFVLGTAAALWGIVWLAVAITRRRRRPRAALFAVVAPLVDLAIVAVITGGVFAGSCTEDETRIAEEIPPFGGGEIVYGYEAQSGSCAAGLDVTASAEDVLDHYERELEADGWGVVVEPTTTEGSDGSFAAFDLSAGRGDDRFTIALEAYQGRVSAAIRIDA
ncbi:MAG TPA: hypothetical protein VF044_08375 [Actinomycetota bacterium]